MLSVIFKQTFYNIKYNYGKLRNFNTYRKKIDNIVLFGGNTAYNIQFHHQWVITSTFRKPNQIPMDTSKQK